MKFTSDQKLLLSLLRSHFGEDCECAVPEGFDWEKFTAFMIQQGVFSFAAEEAIRRKLPVPETVQNAWQTIMYRSFIGNEQNLNAQDALIAHLEQANIPHIILKGTSAASYYPEVKRRMLGDIDVLVPEDRLNDACDVVLSMKYDELPYENKLHRSFKRGRVSIEIHRSPAYVSESDGGQAAKEIISHYFSDARSKCIGNHRFPALSETHQALNTLMHISRHLLDEGVGLRQLLDWLMYISNTDPDTFNKETIPVLRKTGLLVFADILTRTGEKYLSIRVRGVRFGLKTDEIACDMLMENMFKSGNLGKSDKRAKRFLFVDRETVGSGNSRYYKAVFKRVANSVHNKYPASKNRPLLFPAYLCMTLFTYGRMVQEGKREKIPYFYAVYSAKQNEKLTKRLHLHETEKENR